MPTQKPSVLKYDGYTAQLEINGEDDIISGEVLGIRDAITFQGKTAAEVRKAFHEAVDAYKALCEKEGKEPERSFSGNIPFRTTPKVHEAISRAALQRGQSVNAWMNAVLAEAAQKELQPSQEIRDLSLKAPEKVEVALQAAMNARTLLDVMLSSLDAAKEMVAAVGSLRVDAGELPVTESVLQSLGTYRDRLVTVTGGEQAPGESSAPKGTENVKVAETAARRNLARTT
jgi:predicted HicB family RNase H-like nuclease